VGVAGRLQRRRDLREHTDIVDITKMLDLSRWTTTCPDMRVIVRRELPHPGATLDAVEVRDGYPYQAFTTNTRSGQLAFLKARHRAHARVEDQGSAPARPPDSDTSRVGTRTSTRSGPNSP